MSNYNFEDRLVENEQEKAPETIISDEAKTLFARSCGEFVGLAPFLRLSIAGGEIGQLGQLLLDEAWKDQENPNLWMNVSTVLYALQVDALAETFQQQALMQQRTFVRKASESTKFRLLMLLTPGNLSDNMPLDCLLEDSSVELIYQYILPEESLPTGLPEHDALIVAFSGSEANRPLLERLDAQLKDWHRPVIIRPHHVPNTERQRASELLQGVPGLMIPPTHEMDRSQIEAISNGKLEGSFAKVAFPLIVRPISSHGGHGLERIVDEQELVDYLNQTSSDRYYVSPFIDYSSSDGQFRKYRVVLVDGKPFASHMAISTHWMVHYLNAGMYEDATKRAEEQAFMENFDDFAQRHANTLRAIHERSGLDYLCIDCAETQDGKLLIFEIDHLMVVHAMDSVDLFPYKQVHMAKVQRAFENYLFGLIGKSPLI